MHVKDLHISKHLNDFPILVFIQTNLKLSSSSSLGNKSYNKHFDLLDGTYEQMKMAWGRRYKYVVAHLC